MKHQSSVATPALVAEWAEQYRAGASLKNLVEKYQRDGSGIMRRLRQAGVFLRPVGMRRTQIDDAKVKTMIDQGSTVQSIATALNVSRSIVRWSMKRQGLRSHHFFAAPGSDNYAWNNGRTIHGAGYVLIRMPDHPHATQAGFVLEHRLVMEKILGRYLTPEEVVHHKDHDRQNNSPDNLELFPDDSAHMKHEHRLLQRPRLAGRFRGGATRPVLTIDELASRQPTNQTQDKPDITQLVLSDKEPQP